MRTCWETAEAPDGWVYCVAVVNYMPGEAVAARKLVTGNVGHPSPL